MKFEEFSFGSIRIDGATYEHDVVIDRGEVSKRQKKASEKFRDEFGERSKTGVPIKKFHRPFNTASNTSHRDRPADA